MSKRYSFTRMSPEQFRQACFQLGLPKDTFCFVTGANPRSYESWNKGEADIPQWVPVLLAMLTVPGARSIALRTATHFFIREDSEPAPQEAIDTGENQVR